jgi:2-iminobutanoate/2-iminopropanoate deaminase
VAKSKSQTGAPLARYAASKRMGDFVFMSGVIAVDPVARKVITSYGDLPSQVRSDLGETGEMSVDIFEQTIRAQSWFVLNRIDAMAREHGGSMRDVFKLVQYFKDLRDYPAYKRVRDMFYPTDPPVSTVVQVSGMLPTEAVLLEVEATAYLPLAGAKRKR